MHGSPTDVNIASLVGFDFLEEFHSSFLFKITIKEIFILYKYLCFILVVGEVHCNWNILYVCLFLGIYWSDFVQILTQGNL